MNGTLFSILKNSASVNIILAGAMSVLITSCNNNDSSIRELSEDEMVARGLLSQEQVEAERHRRRRGDSISPSVSFLMPVDGAKLSGSVDIEASASDNVSVSRVEFYVDGSLLATEYYSPYEAVLDTSALSDGSHSLIAKAFDSSGNQKSAQIGVTIENSMPPPPPPADTTAPVVSINSPADGAVVSGTVAVLASASDNVGVSRVDFLVDGGLVSSDSSAPYSFSLDTKSLANKSYEVIARAFDAANNQSSAAIKLVVDNSAPPPPPPAVCDVNPNSGSELLSNGGFDSFDSQGKANSWTVQTDGVMSVSTSSVAGCESANSAQKLSTSARGDWGMIFYQTPNFVLDQSYKIFIRYKSDLSSAYIELADGPYNNYISSAGKLLGPTDGAWKTLSYSFVYSNSKADQIRIYTGSAGAILIDEFSVMADSVEPPPADTTAPSISISSPSNGATVSGSINFAASASDNVGVTKVEFSVDGGQPLFTDTSSPYSFSLNTGSLSNASHTLIAKAFDAAGNQKSAQISVVVDNTVPPPPPAPDTTAPSISISSPSNGATVSGSISFAANASDNVGVTKVEFSVDGGQPLFTDTSSPYTYSLNTASLSNASHTLMAKAYDAANNQKSAQITVTVNNNTGGGGGGNEPCVGTPVGGGNSSSSVISSAISGADPGAVLCVKAGVYTGGITINKAITVHGEPGAILRASSNGSGTGVKVSNGGTIKGMRVENFDVAFSGSGSNYKILNNHSLNSQYHVYISGSYGLIEGNDFDTCVLWSKSDDTDYGRISGTGHIVRRNYFHGTPIGEALRREDGDYAHNDGLQFEGWTGAILHDVTLEENILTDFVQGFWISDETAPGKIVNLTIRNNIMWGTKFISSGNLQGQPSWTIGIGRSNGDGGSGTVITNNLLYQSSNFIGLRGSSSSATIQGNVISGPGTGGTGYVIREGANNDNVKGSGDLVYRTNYLGPFVPGPILRTNAGFLDESNLLGPDGIPFTSDDGWQPKAAQALGYGPKIDLAD